MPPLPAGRPACLRAWPPPAALPCHAHAPHAARLPLRRPQDDAGAGRAGPLGLAGGYGGAGAGARGAPARLRQVSRRRLLPLLPPPLLRLLAVPLQPWLARCATLSRTAGARRWLASALLPTAPAARLACLACTPCPPAPARSTTTEGQHPHLGAHGLPAVLTPAHPLCAPDPLSPSPLQHHHRGQPAHLGAGAQRLCGGGAHAGAQALPLGEPPARAAAAPAGGAAVGRLGVGPMLELWRMPLCEAGASELCPAAPAVLRCCAALRRSTAAEGPTALPSPAHCACPVQHSAPASTLPRSLPCAAVGQVGAAHGVPQRRDRRLPLARRRGAAAAALPAGPGARPGRLHAWLGGRHRRCPRLPLTLGRPPGGLLPAGNRQLLWVLAPRPVCRALPDALAATAAAGKCRNRAPPDALAPSRRSTCASRCPRAAPRCCSWRRWRTSPR